MNRKLIVLGVTGGIAAFKAAQLCSMLAKEFPVQVVMTEHARRFVTPLLFCTLSQRPVLTSLWETPGEWRPEHVALAGALGQHGPREGANRAVVVLDIDPRFGDAIDDHINAPFRH